MIRKIAAALLLSLVLSVPAQAVILPVDPGWNQGGMVKWESDLFFFRLDYPLWKGLLNQQLEETRLAKTTLATSLKTNTALTEAQRAEGEGELDSLAQAELLYLAELAKTERDRLLLEERPDRSFLPPLLFGLEDHPVEAEALLAETYRMPAIGKETSPFGWRIHPVTGIRSLHEGLDLANQEGTPILAAKSGIVTFAGFNEISGNNILIRHYDGQETAYYHMFRLKAKRGDYVRQGQVIGLMGTTGRSTGNHLHFELRVNGHKVDAAPYIYQGSRREFR